MNSNDDNDVDKAEAVMGMLNGAVVINKLSVNNFYIYRRR